MRKSDIFTLAEIFHEQQYRMRTPQPSAPLVIDCGSNIGLSAVWFLGHHPGARLHGFDVEGSELDVIEGMGDAIRDVGVIVGEFHEALVDESRFYPLPGKARLPAAQTRPQPGAGRTHLRAGSALVSRG